MAGFTRKVDALTVISNEQNHQLSTNAEKIQAVDEDQVAARERLEEQLSKVEARFRASIVKLSEFVEQRFARQLAENRRKQTCLNRRKAEHVAIEKRMDTMDKNIESVRIDLFGEDGSETDQEMKQ